MKKYVAFYRATSFARGKARREHQQKVASSFITDGEIIAEFTDYNSDGKVGWPQLHAAIRHAREMDAVIVIAHLGRLRKSLSFISILAAADSDFVACDQPEFRRETLERFGPAAQAEHNRFAAVARASKRAAEPPPVPQTATGSAEPPTQ